MCAILLSFLGFNQLEFQIPYFYLVYSFDFIALFCFLSPILINMFCQKPTLLFLSGFSQFSASLSTASLPITQLPHSVVCTGIPTPLFQISSLRDSMAEYSSALSDSKFKLDSYCRQLGKGAPFSDEIVEELRQSCEVFETKLVEQSRHMAWVRSAVYSPEKQAHLAWILRVTLKAMRDASDVGNLFSYVPEYYLDSLVGVATVLRSYMHPTVPFDNIEGMWTLRAFVVKDEEQCSEVLPVPEI